MPEAALYRNEDGLAVVTLNRPEVLNALTTGLLDEVSAHLARAEREGARAILLTGAGRGFAAGLDLASIKDQYTEDGGRPDLAAVLRDHFAPVVRQLRAIEIPIVAGVNGVAAGAGMSLALACDLRIASDSARFATAFTRIGLVPDSGIAYILPRLIGAGRARSLLLSGEQMDASTALALGMVDRVAAAADFESAALAYARSFAEGPTRAFGLTKRLLNASELESLDRVLVAEEALQTEAAATSDHGHAIAAFLRKEPPHFGGR